MDGDAEAIAQLVGAGADPCAADHSGYTPLHFAAQYQRAPVVAMLIGAGAEIDARDGWGNTALFRAVFNSRGEGDTIAALLAAGADPDATNDSGVSPRSLASTIANYDVAQYLS
jgi:ankyrin repeat protein